MESETKAAKNFWEANPFAAQERQWTSDNLVADEVYKRISGRESSLHWMAWLFDSYFKDKTFDRIISAGCGVGDHETAMGKISSIRNIEAFDISQSSLDEARNKAKLNELKHIKYFQADLNTVKLPAESYDLALVSGSLHHVRELEHFLESICNSLKPEGYFIVNEYIGDCYNIYSSKQLKIINQLLSKIPKEALTIESPYIINPTIHMVMERDPSEAVRSKLIPEFLQFYFDIEIERKFGGHLMHTIYPFLNHEYLSKNIVLHDAIIGLILSFESILMDINDEMSDFSFFICRRKGQS